MDIIIIIKTIVYYVLLIFIIINKNIKKMSKFIQWFKNLFAKKQVKNEDTSIKTAAIPNPDGTPTKRPK